MIGKGVNFTFLKYASHYMSAQCLQKMEICPKIGFFYSKQRILHRAPWCMRICIVIYNLEETMSYRT